MGAKRVPWMAWWVPVRWATPEEIEYRSAEPSPPGGCRPSEAFFHQIVLIVCVERFTHPNV